MAQEQKSSIYLLLDEVGNALAQVRPQGPSATEGSLWQLVVMNDKIDEVLEYKQFKLLSIQDSSPSYEVWLVWLVWLVWGSPSGTFGQQLY